MASHLLSLVAVATLAWPGPDPAVGQGAPGFLRMRLMELRADPAPGILVNVSPGLRPFDPTDPSRPTLVLVHGINLMPNLTRFRMAEQLGEAIRARGGRPVNVMSWAWNADTFIGPHASGNHQHAVQHGRRMALALLGQGVVPENLHLIGQSSGAIVVAAAAREILERTGRPVTRVTLLDPAASYHDVVFSQLGVLSTARCVEHYWAPGLTGFSRPTGFAGLQEYRVEIPTGILASADPARTAHWNTVRWYIATAGDLRGSDGFNRSEFAR